MSEPPKPPDVPPPDVHSESRSPSPEPPLQSPAPPRPGGATAERSVPIAAKPAGDVKLKIPATPVGGFSAPAQTGSSATSPAINVEGRGKQRWQRAFQKVTSPGEDMLRQQSMAGGMYQDRRGERLPSRQSSRMNVNRQLSYAGQGGMNYLGNSMDANALNQLASPRQSLSPNKIKHFADLVKQVVTNQRNPQEDFKFRQQQAQWKRLQYNTAASRFGKLKSSRTATLQLDTPAPTFGLQSPISTVFTPGSTNGDFSRRMLGATRSNASQIYQAVPRQQVPAARPPTERGLSADPLPTTTGQRETVFNFSKSHQEQSLRAARERQEKTGVRGSQVLRKRTSGIQRAPSQAEVRSKQSSTRSILQKAYSTTDGPHNRILAGVKALDGETTPFKSTPIKGTEKLRVGNSKSVNLGDTSNIVAPGITPPREAGQVASPLGGSLNYGGVQHRRHNLGIGGKSRSMSAAAGQQIGGQQAIEMSDMSGLRRRQTVLPPLNRQLTRQQSAAMLSRQRSLFAPSDSATKRSFGRQSSVADPELKPQNPSMTTYAWRLVKHAVNQGINRETISKATIIQALTKPEEDIKVKELTEERKSQALQRNMSLHPGSVAGSQVRVGSMLHPVIHEEESDGFTANIDLQKSRASKGPRRGSVSFDIPEASSEGGLENLQNVGRQRSQRDQQTKLLGLNLAPQQEEGEMERSADFSDGSGLIFSRSKTRQSSGSSNIPEVEPEHTPTTESLPEVMPEDDEDALITAEDDYLQDGIYVDEATGQLHYYDDFYGHPTQFMVGEDGWEEDGDWAGPPEDYDEDFHDVPRQPGGIMAAGWVSPKTDIQTDVIEQLNQMPDHRPYFTYWITTVQIIICVVMLIQYDITEFGMQFTAPNKTKDEMQPVKKLFSPTYVKRKAELNFWIGPRKQDLVHFGAKYAPCIRQDWQLEKCHKQKSQAKSVCCIDPFFLGRDQKPLCANVKPDDCPAAYRQTKGKCNDNKTSGKHSRNLGGGFNDQCFLIGRPCCRGMEGRCEIRSRDWCVHMGGMYHGDKATCEEVNCQESVCGLIPFLFGSSDKSNPDQWYRLWLAIFIHYGVLHCIVSIIFQLTMLKDLEVLCGWLNTALIYMLSGIIGNLASAMFLPYSIDAGPTPAQFGIIACSFVEIIQLWQLFQTPWKVLARYLIFLLMLFAAGLLPLMDNFSNIAGFLSGALLAFALLPYVTFGEPDRRRKLITQWLAWALWLVLLVVLLVGVVNFKDHSDYKWLNAITCISNSKVVQELFRNVLKGSSSDIDKIIGDPAECNYDKPTTFKIQTECKDV